MTQGQLDREIFHWIFELLRIDVPPQRVGDAIRNVQVVEDGGELSWQERATLIAEPLDLSLVPVRATVESLREGEDLFPLIARREGPEGPLWLGVSGRDRGQYRVFRFGLDQEDQWISEPELRSWLELYPTEPVDWVTFESVAPLTPWKRDPEEEPTAAVWGRLWSLLRSEKREIWVILVYAVAIGVMTLVTPIAVQSLVNTVAFGALLQPLVVLSVMLAVGLIFLAVLQAAQTYLGEMISRRIFVRVVSDFSHRLSRAKQSELKKFGRAKLSNYFFDVLTVQKVTGLLLLDGLAALLSILSGLLLLAVYHPALLAFDLFLLLGMGVLIFILGRGAIESSFKESKKKHEAGAWLDQVAQQDTLYKSQGGRELLLAQADTHSRQYLQARSKHFRIVMKQLLGGLAIQVLASAGLLLVGGWLVIREQLTLGQLVASELVVSVLVASLFKLVKSFEKFYDLLAAMGKLGIVIDLELERSDGLPLLPTSASARLEIRDLGHQTTTGVGSFRQLDIEVEPGMIFGLQGVGDEGYSTLGSILFGLQRPQTGQVLLNGCVLQDLRLDDLRRAVSLVRESQWVEGSILENLQLERAHVSRLLARRALDLSGLLPAVLELPEGIHTPLKEAGFTPLQEKQLTLARAIANQPNLLVVDGTFDNLSEAWLETFFTRYKSWNQAPTLVLLTRRPELLEWCDSFVQMKPLKGDAR